MKSLLSKESDGTVSLKGIVERVTFHSADTGWSVLKVKDFGSRSPDQLVTVVLHQAQVFAGSSMQFWGTWSRHPKHGDQFRSERCLELKPATSGALEKYLGSGLIKGVGPVIARRIVSHFGSKTLEVFESRVDDLLMVPGIAEKKLLDIRESWSRHKAIRDVMLFLQGHGISTLYAVKIFKAYGDDAIERVSEDPYRLARDIYGIGFFSADKIARSLGFAEDSSLRLGAGIRHALSAAREQGHCYLTNEQILTQTLTLLDLNPQSAGALAEILARMEANHELRTRPELGAYYAKSLFYDERTVETQILSRISAVVPFDRQRAEIWLDKSCERQLLQLSEEQRNAVLGIPTAGVALLTGGPGCGKTTTTRMLAKLFVSMGRRVVLGAPTGRAAQRMAQVIGMEAKTIHRLLGWAPAKNGFLHDENNRLELDVLILDECSMLDISLAASILRALPPRTQLCSLAIPISSHR
jgi:exodeoxyribonuclease V alpha subunit